MEEPSIYERYCVNAYDRIVSFCQLRLVMDRYNTIYRELGNYPAAARFCGQELLCRNPVSLGTGCGTLPEEACTSNGGAGV